jgi:enoyl-CoA hydratase
MSPDESQLIVSVTENAVGVLRLNRPKQKNAISTPLLSLISKHLSAMDEDPKIRCVIITGSSDVFAAGADATEILEKNEQDARDDIRPQLWGSVRKFSKPIIAAVEGWCLGAGCELAMCCDIVIAGETAKFGQPETNLGIMPGAGGTVVLPRLIGRAVAMKMVLLGETITAREAVHYGLALEEVESGKAYDRSLAIAEKLAGRAPLALRHAKASLNAAFNLPSDQHLQFERDMFAKLFATEDKKEGLSAFLDKRSPTWKGH